MIKNIAFAALMVCTVSGCAPSAPLFGSAENNWKGDAIKAEQLRNAHYIAEETPASGKASPKVTFKTITATADCKHKKTAHNPVNYFPLIGPMLDLQTIPNSDQLLWWELPLSMLVPLIGPSIVSTQGSQICIH